MKTNLKGSRGVKALLLLHGEKVAIAVVGLLALWFVYDSFTLPKLEPQYQASNLREQINQTNLELQRAEWPSPDSELASEVRYAQPIAQAVANEVNSKAYEISTALAQPVVAPTVLRVDPPVLNATDVRAIGGSGLFAFVDEELQKKWQVEQARKQEELQKKQQEEQKRQERMQMEAGRNPQARRGRDVGMEMPGYTEYDPQNPDRRPVEGMMRPAGVPLQGGERIEMAHWAMVVAKVPIREQLKHFQNAFENAKGGYDPTRDFPNYIGYIVQRTEVVAGKPLEWKEVPVYAPQRKSSLNIKMPLNRQGMADKVMAQLYEASREWAGGGPMPDPVDERYTDYVLTFPLPPLVGRDWGADATHPDIPLAIHAPPPEPEMDIPLAQGQPTGKPEETEEGLTFGVDPSLQPSFPGAGGPMMMERSPMNSLMPLPGPGPGPGGMYGGMSRFSREMDEMPRGFGFGRSGEGPGPMGPMASYSAGARSMAQKTTLSRGVDYWLLRFMDFTVEPGKKYKYRVKLILRDPNFGVDKNFLAPAVLDRKQSIARYVDDWSEPSPTVGIPLAGSVRLAEAKPKSEKLYNDEPSVNLLVESFELDSQGAPIQAAKELKDFRRGFVANTVQDARYLEADGRSTNLMKSFKFFTGITLLDVRGGDRLARDVNAPARALLMGPAGDLYVRNELDDKPMVEYYRLLFAEPDKRRGRGEEDMLQPFGEFPGPGPGPGPGMRPGPRRSGR